MSEPAADHHVSLHDRYQVREISRAVNETALAAQVSVRRYRNALIVATFALIVCAIGFPLGAQRFDQDIVTIRVLPVPAATSTTPTTPATPAPTERVAPAAPTEVLTGDEPTALSKEPVTWGDVASIEGWGVLGGIIGAVASLKRIRTSRDPTSLHLAQLALKLPAGALTALFGVVLLQSSVLAPLKIAPNSQLAAYAVLFGFAQEVVTRLVDQQSNRILDNAKLPGQLTAG